MHGCVGWREQVEVKGAKGKPNVVVSKDDGLSKVTLNNNSLPASHRTHRWRSVFVFFSKFGREREGAL